MMLDSQTSYRMMLDLISSVASSIRRSKDFVVVSKEEPAEARNALSRSERYHGVLGRIFRKIKVEHPTLSDAADPEGLCPTALAFGMLSKLPLANTQALPENQREKFAAIETACKEMETIVAEQRLKIAKLKRAPELETLKPAPGDPILALREAAKAFKGPYTRLSQDNKCNV